MGLGKSLRKAWKKTFGKLEDVTKPYMPIIAGTVLGAVTGGLGGVAVGLSEKALGYAIGAGGVLGAGAGTTQYLGMRSQEKALKAQIASSEKIAQMQQATVVSAAPIPTQTAQTAAINEQNEATRKARAFRLSNSIRGSLGGGFGNKRKTLG